VIIAKQRNGPTGTVKLQFNSKQTRFGNLAHGGDGYEAPAATQGDLGTPF
jgi:replicative DNA helicase